MLLRASVLRRAAASVRAVPPPPRVDGSVSAVAGGMRSFSTSGVAQEAGKASTGAAGFSFARAVARPVYKHVWRKRSSLYLLWLGITVVVGEMIYSNVMDSVWVAANRGKLAEHIDFSKWEQLVEAEDEDEDDDDGDEDDDE